MAAEVDLSHHDDPFHSSSVLSLLPQTLGRSNVASDAEEFDSVASVFRSMVVKSSTQLVQQAQTIAKSFTESQSSDTGAESIAGKVKDRPQERRPALGRKRAKFSLKPVQSSLPSIDISSNLDNIEDPEEFFLAYEQLDNADKELKKIGGRVSESLPEHNQFTTTRRRRPGLLGKTSHYKHHSSIDANAVDILTQEEPVNDRFPSSSSISTGVVYTEMIANPTNEPHISPAKNSSIERQEFTKRRDSLTVKADNVDNLFEMLLTSFKDVDGGKDTTYLRESLKIKSIDTGKINLPQLENINNSQHSASKFTTRDGDLKDFRISPTLTRSPLEKISGLAKRISLNNPLKDLYSKYPADDAPSSGDEAPSKNKSKRSHSPINFDNHVNSTSPMVENATTRGFDDQICSPISEVGRSSGKKGISEDEHTEHSHHIEGDVSREINEFFGDKDGVDGGLQEEDMQVDPETTNQEHGFEGLSCMNQLTTQEPLDHPLLIGTDTNGDSCGVQEKNNLSGIVDADLQVKESNSIHQNILQINQPNSLDISSLSSVNETATGSLHGPNGNVDNNCTSVGDNIETRFSGFDDIPQDANAKQANVNIRESKDISSHSEQTAVEDQHLEHDCSLPDENHEGHGTISVAPQNEGRRQKAPQRTKKKYEGRKSLAGAGTVWENGRRKSSRHRVRRLEHWRGERLLYGRIHDSLTTVIGVKYASPGKESLKVESYVSEQYADLVAQAARY